MYSHWLILSADGNHRIRADAFCQTVAARSIKEKLRLGIGQITRPLGTHPVNPQEGVRALNALQKFLVEETRLGIPAISHEECLMGLMVKGATLFPSALNYGSTWNPDLIEAVGQEIRKEAKQVGCHQGLAPVLDVSRDVRWGRTEETMGEDAGINLLYTHHRVAKDKAEAAALAFNSGLAVELPGFECAEHLEQAVECHQISEKKSMRSWRGSWPRNSVLACLKIPTSTKTSRTCNPTTQGTWQKRWRCNRSSCWKTGESCLLTSQRNQKLL